MSSSSFRNAVSIERSISRALARDSIPNVEGTVDGAREAVSSRAT